jgi:hypothetical protein
VGGCGTPVSKKMSSNRLVIMVLVMVTLVMAAVISDRVIASLINSSEHSVVFHILIDIYGCETWSLIFIIKLHYK